MRVREYAAQVFHDAMEQMQETYDIYSWEEQWEDLCSSSTVTGRECGRYRGMSREQACGLVSGLVFDDHFRNAYRRDMGCDILDDNDCDPLGFDCDVRLWCLVNLHDLLRSNWMSLVMFGVPAYRNAPRCILEEM